MNSWLIDGNCKVCRRKNYCTTECKKHRVNRKRSIYNALMSATGAGRMLDMMSTSTYNAQKTAEYVAKQIGMLE